MRFLKTVVTAAPALLMLTLCACADVSAPDTASPATMPAPDPKSMVSAVSVEFNSNMQQLAASDPRLTPAAIAVAVENELRAQQLYAPAVASVHRTLAISVEDFTSTLAGNTSVLGFAAHDVVLLGEVEIKGEPPPGHAPFEVHARDRLTNRGRGASGGSLADLYETFAVLTVANLRSLEGVPESQAHP